MGYLGGQLSVFPKGGPEWGKKKKKNVFFNL